MFGLHRLCGQILLENEQDRAPTRSQASRALVPKGSGKARHLQGQAVADRTGPATLREKECRALYLRGLHNISASQRSRLLVSVMRILGATPHTRASRHPSASPCC